MTLTIVENLTKVPFKFAFKSLHEEYKKKWHAKGYLDTHSNKNKPTQLPNCSLLLYTT